MTIGSPERSLLIRKVKISRHDADHDERRPVDHHRATDGVAAPAEALRPQRVADHDDVAARSAVLLGAERAAQRGGDAENGEETHGDGCRGDAFRFAAGVVAPRQSDARRAVRADVRVRPTELAHPRELRERRAVERDELLGMRIGERSNDDGVDDGEDGGVGADTERERADRNRRERRGAAQAAQRVAHVLQQIFHEISPMLRARLVSIVIAKLGADAVDVAESPAGRGHGRVVRQSARFVIAHSHFQMERQLVVDVGVRIGAEEAEVAAPARGHVRPPPARRGGRALRRRRSASTVPLRCANARVRRA